MPKGVYPHTHVKPVARSLDLLAEIQRLYDLQWSQEEIGHQLGMGQQTVSKIMKRYGIKARIAAKRDQTGAKNHMWKGDGASYQALHVRVENRRGTPRVCDRCGSADQPGVIYEWANLSGNFTDMDDYQRMCRSCHRRYDNARRRGGDAS